MKSEEYRGKQIKAQKQAQNRLRTKRKKSEAMKAARARGTHDHIYTEEWRQKISKAARIAQNCPEVKRKISEASKAAWVRGAFDKRNASEEWKQKIANGVRAAHARGDYGFTGEKNPGWHGGISFEPYGPEWTTELKKIVRERDGYECVICGANGKCVHHIDYNKKNHDLNNLITLCRSCHTKTNWGRDFWQSYFEGQVYLAMGAC